MTECVMQVFFGKGEGVDNWPDFVEPEYPEFMGVPLWRPGGRAVYVWAVDYVVATDQRWTVFGPFENKAAALAVFAEKFAHLDVVHGYRIEDIYSARSIIGRKRRIWTDG